MAWRILQELGRVGVLLHLEVRRSKGTIVRPRSLMSYALCPEYVRLFLEYYLIAMIWQRGVGVCPE